MWGIVLVIMVTKDCECFTTCRTMTNCPFLNENGGSSKHSKRSEYFLYFNVLFKTFKEIFCKELLFFGNFFYFSWVQGTSNDVIHFNGNAGVRNCGNG